MVIWVHIVCYDGEMHATAHLTERGALQAGIIDMVEYFGLQSEEEITCFLEKRAVSMSLDPREIELDMLPWRGKEIKEMNRDDLYTAYGEWSELMWDDPMYENTIIATKLEA